MLSPYDLPAAQPEIPLLAISLAVLGFDLFSDTLGEAWDPKLRGSS
jgi:ABC-type dipeptide/oligopeptide/nickel transport system permease subunit